MKCVSRSTFGVVIGGIIIFGFSLTLIYIAIVLHKFSILSDEDSAEHSQIVSKSVTLLYVLLAICLFAIIISALLIAGIVKRSYKLMRPWVFCAIAGIICHIFRLLISLVASFGGEHPFSDVFVSLIVGLCTLGIQYLIFRTIYNLYKDIRDNGYDQELAGLNSDLNTGCNNGLNADSNTADANTRSNTDQDKPPSYGELYN